MPGEMFLSFEKGKITVHKNDAGVKLSNTASISGILQTLP